jgi:hypothetical protein
MYLTKKLGFLSGVRGQNTVRSLILRSSAIELKETGDPTLVESISMISSRESKWGELNISFCIFHITIRKSRDIFLL